jgi:hypothetical protein
MCQRVIELDPVAAEIERKAKQEKDNGKLLGKFPLTSQSPE